MTFESLRDKDEKCRSNTIKSEVHTTERKYINIRKL
jgi:hypothetical protein